MKTKFTIFFLVCSMVFACDNSYNNYQELEDGLYAEFNTNMGVMLIKLTYDKTPVTVANFVALAEGNHPKVDNDFKGIKFYNGIIFHRVIDKFMIQGGDPKGDGTGGPGYRFLDEFDDSLKHDQPGMLSMANSGPGTNGSQFFITEVPTPHLDGKHTVFGYMVKGIEIQDTISNVETAVGNRPVNDVKINELNIIRVGSKAKDFDAVKTWSEMEPKLFITQQVEQEKKIKKMDSLASLEKKVNRSYKSKSSKLNSGVKVHFIKKGKGIKPNNGDEIFFYYEGYLADNGLMFGTNRKEKMIDYGMYSKDEENKGWYDPSKITYSSNMALIEGFKEVLMMMSVGDKVYAYIPSDMGYGNKAMGNRIPANSDLEFIIELVDISN
ncbi:MAG: peptidylprolyl isomerase [Flavobacteriaceae bacterium]|nr:peptidylprolyl isomerase [Flavobacteriaceae bacterium]